jgi:hypothetical protein
LVEVSTDELRHAVEYQHGGTATLVQSVSVGEAFRNETVWDGIVHVFDLAGHRFASRAYAWSSEIEGGARRFYAVLRVPLAIPQQTRSGPLSLRV